MDQESEAWIQVNLADAKEELARLTRENAKLHALGDLTVQDINLLLSWVDMRDLEYGGLSQEDIALQAKLEIIREKMTTA